jgi:uncharacterized protein (DUF1501 family)
MNATTLNRRQLLQSLSAFGLSSLVTTRVLAESNTDKTFVFVFMRGAVDGLSMVPPLGDNHYGPLRPTLKLLNATKGADAALALDGYFGLHPAMQPLHKYYASKQLSIVHATGQLNASRSHFDAQDFLESGTAGRKTNDGFLNRASKSLLTQSVFQSVALQNGLPFSLSGEAHSLAFSSLKEFRIGSSGVTAASFESLYASAVDDALRGAGHEAFQGLNLAQQSDLSSKPALNGAVYPKSQFAARLQDIARMIHGGVGLKIAVTEMGGFDTHLGQGAGTGNLSRKLAEFSEGLASFCQDLGPKLNSTCVVCVTEFGRTAKENGTKGTDHGTGSAALILGGGHSGGRVISKWPTLAPTALFEGRDLAVTTDIRHILSECLENTLGVSGASVFPDYVTQKVGLF